MRAEDVGTSLRPTLGDFVMLWILLVTVAGVAGLSLFIVETPAFRILWLVYAGVGVLLIRDRLRRMVFRC